VHLFAPRVGAGLRPLRQLAEGNLAARIAISQKENKSGAPGGTPIRKHRFEKAGDDGGSLKEEAKVGREH